MLNETLPTSPATDILATIEKEADQQVTFDVQDPLGSISITKVSPLTRFRRASLPKIQFLFYYLSISAIVFVILLTTTNWNSYSAIVSNYLNPEALNVSKNDILSVLDKSRVMVYADNTTNS
jgi:hypothetical protein